MQPLNMLKNDMVLCAMLGHFISKGITTNERIERDRLDKQVAQDTRAHH
jgi:hypothetical protein